MSYLPYVYYLVFTHPETREKLYYVGCQYGAKAHPSNLLTTYLTSSSRVQELIEEFGKECFKTSIRKIFKTIKETKRYERKLLTKLRAKQRTDFINKSNANFGDFVKNGPLCKKSKSNFNRNYKQNSTEKYGVEHPLQLDIFLNKKKNTSLLKYGFDIPMKNPEISGKVCKRVSFQGVEFNSIKDAAQFYQVANGTISKWLKLGKKEAYYIT
jgi:hypothetical protein